MWGSLPPRPRVVRASRLAASLPVRALIANTPSLPVVKDLPLRHVDLRPEDVRIVGHEDDEGAVHIGAVRGGELQVERLVAGRRAVSGSNSFEVSILASRYDSS
jgi:hypothetical protein